MTRREGKLFEIAFMIFNFLQACAIGWTRKGHLWIWFAEQMKFCYIDLIRNMKHQPRQAWITEESLLLGLRLRDIGNRQF